MWFEDLMGFKEVSPEHVISNISVDGNRMISKVNKASFQCGIFRSRIVLLKTQIKKTVSILFKGFLKDVVFNGHRIGFDFVVKWF